MDRNTDEEEEIEEREERADEEEGDVPSVNEQNILSNRFHNLVKARITFLICKDSVQNAESDLKKANDSLMFNNLVMHSQRDFYHEMYNSAITRPLLQQKVDRATADLWKANGNMSDFVKVSVMAGYKNGEITAKEVYMSMLKELKQNGVEPNDADTYHDVIKVLGQLGDMEVMKTCFEEMKERGMKPDESTYSTMISACGESRDYKMAKRFFQEMKDQGLTPSPGCTKMMKSIEAEQYREQAGEFA